MGKYMRVLVIIIVVMFAISLMGCSDSKRTSELEKTVADLQNKLSELQNETAVIAEETAAITEVTTAPETTQSEITQAQETATEATAEKVGVIEKKIGDKIDIGGVQFIVNGLEEKTSLTGIFDDVTKAGEGTKFIVLNSTITNITKEQFRFWPDDIFRIIDSQERQYKAFEDSIGATEDYLYGMELNPSIPEKGTLVYEVPIDADSYNLFAADENSNLIKVLLK